MSKHPATRFKELMLEQEKLRLVHNEMGRRFREGEISGAFWRQYKGGQFSIEQGYIASEIAAARREMMLSIDYELQPTDTSSISYPKTVNTDAKKFHYCILMLEKLRSGGQLNREDSRLQDALSNEYSALKLKFQGREP